MLHIERFTKKETEALWTCQEWDENDLHEFLTFYILPAPSAATQGHSVSRRESLTLDELLSVLKGFDASHFSLPCR